MASLLKLVPGREAACASRVQGRLVLSIPWSSTRFYWSGLDSRSMLPPERADEVRDVARLSGACPAPTRMKDTQSDPPTSATGFRVATLTLRRRWELRARTQTPKSIL